MLLPALGPVGAATNILGPVGVATNALGVGLHAYRHYQAADRKRRYLERAVGDVEMIRDRDVQQLQERAEQLQGLQTTRLAASGVDVHSDTAQALAASTTHITKQDRDTVRLNAARQALGLREEADSISPWREGAIPLLGGMGPVADYFYHRFRKHTQKEDSPR